MSQLVSTILGVSGSPRRGGNTDLLVREALRLLAERTDAATGFLRVADLRIEACRGCRACMKLGHCAIQDDDFEALMARLRAADLLVLGAPVYWLGPPGVMKNFIDRTHGYYRDHTLLRGKRAVLISVATESGFEPHEAVMASWLRVYGARILGSIRVLSCEKGEVLQRPEEFSKVRQLVDSLVL
ncbi:MAG: flavodoxin family protein [Planctomycetes bacterium]|nr:flavodoxin family protein [Planctomycetota bacterium]